MREAPSWFQDELARIGGRNLYGEPIFRLAWSTGERRVIGGRWTKDGFVGYREVPGVPGLPCWALMVYEPRELLGSLDRWERDYRDEETGLLDCGSYSKYGRYRLLQRFIHQEVISQPKEVQIFDGFKIRRQVTGKREVVTYRMEPCGFILDVMMPMLLRWRRLSDAAKVEALLQEERIRDDEFTKMTKNAIEGTRLSRVMRSSQLVQKRAEIIERGFRQAMAVAAHTGLGMRVSA